MSYIDVLDVHLMIIVYISMNFLEIKETIHVHLLLPFDRVIIEQRSVETSMQLM